MCLVNDQDPMPPFRSEMCYLSPYLDKIAVKLTMMDLTSRTNCVNRNHCLLVIENPL